MTPTRGQRHEWAKMFPGTDLGSVSWTGDTSWADPRPKAFRRVGKHHPCWR